MNTSIGIIVDSSCSLPEIVRRQPNLITIPARTQAEPLFSTETISANEHSLAQQLKNQLIFNFDQLLFITPPTAINHTKAYVEHCILMLQPELLWLRRQANLHSPLRIRILESCKHFSGYGLLTYAALRFSNTGQFNIDQVKSLSRQVAVHSTTYLLPTQSAHLHLSPFKLSWLQRKYFTYRNKTTIFELQPPYCRAVHQLETTQETDSLLRWIKTITRQNQFMKPMMYLSLDPHTSRLKMPQLINILCKQRYSLINSRLDTDTQWLLGKGALTLSLCDTQAIQTPFTLETVNG